MLAVIKSDLKKTHKVTILTAYFFQIKLCSNKLSCKYIMLMIEELFMRLCLNS